MDEVFYEVDEYGDDILEHHGIKGMKWGVWNAETAARYAGITENVRKKLSSKMTSLSTKHKETSLRRAEERQAEAQAKKEHKAFDKETRKKYHLSAKQYKALRETTLNSNDPTVVRRGMHLLSDEELNQKINRLSRENEIRKLASAKETADATARTKANEARQKTLRYELGKAAGNMAINVAKESLIKPGADKLYKRIEDSMERSRKQYDRQVKRQEEKEQKQQEKREQKKEQKARDRVVKKEQEIEERRKKAASDTERVKEILGRGEKRPEPLALPAPTQNLETKPKSNPITKDVLRGYDNRDVSDEFRKRYGYRVRYGTSINRSK